MNERVSQNRYQLSGEKNWKHEIEAKCARPVQDGVQTVKEGLDGGYKCQLSVKISAICQLSVKWLLMINYETYLYIFDAKFGLKGTFVVN